MTPEQQLWQRVKSALSYRYPYSGHLVRVENALDAGTPDVNWCLDEWITMGRVRSCQRSAEGWLELKVAALPIRDDSKMRVQSSPAQRVWWMKRAKCGGRVHVLIWLRHPTSTKSYHLLFTGEVAAQLMSPMSRKLEQDVPRATLARFRSLAVAEWGPALDHKTLIKALTGWKDEK